MGGRGAAGLKSKYRGNYGVSLVRCDTQPLWTMPEKTKPTALIKAGRRLYVAMPNKVLALSAKHGEATPMVDWQAETGGTPSELAAADGKLFITTREGRPSASMASGRSHDTGRARWRNRHWRRSEAKRCAGSSNWRE